MSRRPSGDRDWRTIINTVLAIGAAFQMTFEQELLAAHWNRITLKILAFGALAANLAWSQRHRLNEKAKP